MKEYMKELLLMDKIMRLTKLLNLHRIQFTKETDATTGQGRLLKVLSKGEKISSGELAYVLQIKQQSLNELLLKLEKKELIKREKDESDKRRTLISLTEKGKINVPEPPKELLQIFDCLNQEEKNNLMLYLDKITSSLVDKLNLLNENIKLKK